MKKSFIVALMMSTFLTGCQTEASAINGSKASNRIAEDAVDIIGSDGSSDLSSEIGMAAEEDASDDADEQKYGSYEQFIDDIRYCVEKGDLKGLDVSSNAYNSYMSEVEDLRYGYVIEDLDGDGVKELIIGANKCIKDTDISGKDRYHTLIFDIFTLQESVMVHVLKTEDDEIYYFGTDGTIIKEDSRAAMMPSKSILEVVTFYRYNEDNLEIVEGIRDEYIVNSDRIRYFYSDENPYWDTSNQISYEKWKEIVDNHGNQYVKFTDFSEPRRTGRKAKVYVREVEEDYRDSRMQYKWRDYIVFYSDNSGIYNVGNGENQWFVWNEERIQYDNDPSRAVKYFVEGDVLKLGDEEYILEQ